MNRYPGSVRLLSIGSTPVFLHWSFPVGGLFVSSFVHFRIPETYFFCLGYTLVIALHEFAHAAAARIFGLQVQFVYVAGLGGECGCQVPKSFLAAIITFSAGLLAQSVLLILTTIYVGVLGWPGTALGASLVITFTVVNGALVVLNLIPQKPRRANFGSDGYLIWKLIGNKFRGRPYVFPDTSATFAPETRLLGLQGFAPKGFLTGIEILNDNTTPMEFVIDVMTRHLELPQDKAFELMLAVHTKGGVLIPVETYELAVKAAAAISVDAIAKGHRLVCRPVDAREPRQTSAAHEREIQTGPSISSSSPTSLTE